MYNLTPEERERIYEEEKARIEAREQIQQQVQEQALVPANRPVRPVHPIVAILSCVFFIWFGSFLLSASRRQDVSAAPVSSSTAPPPPASAAIFDTGNEAEKQKVIVVAGYTWSNEVYTDAYDSIHGSVKNGSSLTVTYWKATAQYFNKHGEIIDTAYTNSGETLLPGAKKRFDIMHSHLPEAVKVHVFVEEVRFD